jgi:ZIP family zinc transporter
MRKEETNEEEEKIYSIHDENDDNHEKSHDRIQLPLNNHDDHKKKDSRKKKIKSIALAIIPLIILTGMVYFLLSPYGQNLINTGIPLPEVSIEKIEFHENQIVAFIRNTGPEEITISQADVNDRIQSAAIEPSKTLAKLSEAKIIIPFFWNPSEPYEIGITTSDGTRFSKIIDAAAPAPIPNAFQVSMFAILGVFVGVIPVMIGLVWYPFLRKISSNKYNFFLSLTAGLLVFLGIDALLESNEIVVDNLATIFNGQILIFVISISTFLLLLYVSERLTKRATEKLLKKTTDFSSSSLSLSSSKGKKVSSISTTKTTSLEDAAYQQNQFKRQQQQQIIKPLAISMMIAIGIGLHNFGEGLAIGSAVLLGKVAFSTFLIVGFTLHNTTEGLAIVATLAKTGKIMIKRLLILGLIAGMPTIAGTWMGGFIYSPLASVIFLSIGAGAIFQVVYLLSLWIIRSSNPNDDDNCLKNKSELISGNTSDSSRMKPPSFSIIAGFITGMLIMYITGLLI